MLFVGKSTISMSIFNSCVGFTTISSSVNPLFHISSHFQWQTVSFTMFFGVNPRGESPQVLLPCPGCDTFVALPPAAPPHTVIFGKNSDRPNGEAQSVRRYPGGTFEPWKSIGIWWGYDTGWWRLEHDFYFSIQLGMSSSQLTFIFFRGVQTTNQDIFGWIHQLDRKLWF